MNLFKRGWYSTTRRPKKSILLAIILCFISLLLIVATGIGGQQRRVQEDIRSRLGGSFRLDRDWDAFNTGYWGPELEWVDFGGGGMMLPNPLVDYQMGMVGTELEQISQLDGISDFNITAEAYRFMPVGFINDSTHIIEGERPDQLLHDKVLLQGVLNAEMLDEIRHGFISLEAGRWIVPADNDNAEIPFVISSNIAEINGLSVGDVMTLDWEDERWDVELDHFNIERLENREISGTIVGIFTVNRSLSPIMNSTSLENTIFSNLDIFETVMGGDSGPANLYIHASFMIDNINVAEQVQTDLENLNIEWMRYVLTSPDDLLAEMSKSFDGLQNISSFMFIGVLVAGFAILWLVFALWVKNRIHEMGILLAVGTQKRNIVVQFIFEAILIAIVSIAISLAVTPAVSNVIDIGNLNTMVENQLSPDAADGLEEGASITADTVGDFMSDDFYQQAMSSLNLNIADILVVILGVLALLTVSILIAMVSIMRVKPKEILAKMN